MSDLSNKTNGTPHMIDSFIRLVLLVGLLVWCGLILAPFMIIVVWGMILAVTTYPTFERMKRMLGGRGRLAALLITAIGLTIIAIPGYLLVSNVVAAITDLKAAYDTGRLNIPTAPEKIKEWPLIGGPFHSIWDAGATNLTNAIEKYQDRLVDIAAWLAATVGKLGLGLLKFILSIIMSGILLMYAKECRAFSQAFFTRLMGARGNSFAQLAEKTVRNVARGIIGVAFIQALAAGTGLFLAGIPYAGPLTLACLVLCIVQAGISLIAVPVMIYSFTHLEPLPAVLLSIWLLMITFSDNFLKPVFLSKGAPVPTLIIFLGSLGGFLLSGIIGLFTGAVILSLGYRLFINWIEPQGQLPVEHESSSKTNA